MGKTGAGKSSLCNALFQGEVTPISNMGACTREALHFRLRNGNHSLMVVDLPSVGENEQRDEEYSTLYRHILPELDLVLWVTRTTGAAPPTPRLPPLLLFLLLSAAWPARQSGLHHGLHQASRPSRP